MGEDHVAGMSSLTSMPDNAGGADMVDGLVTDPTLFPSWGNPGDQIFKWTDDQGTEYFVTASVFRLLNQPWRGQKNVTVDAKPAVKAALRLCKDVPVLKFNTNFETRFPTIADVSTINTHREIVKCLLEEHCFPCHLNAQFPEISMEMEISRNFRKFPTLICHSMEILQL